MSQNLGGLGFLFKSMGIDPLVIGQAAQTIVSIGERVEKQLVDIQARLTRIENRMTGEAVYTNGHDRSPLKITDITDGTC